MSKEADMAIEFGYMGIEVELKRLLKFLDSHADKAPSERLYMLRKEMERGIEEAVSNRRPDLVPEWNK